MAKLNSVDRKVSKKVQTIKARSAVQVCVVDRLNPNNIVFNNGILSIIFAFLTHLLFFVTPYYLNGNIKCMLDTSYYFCFMIYSEVLKNFHFSLFILSLIIITLITIKWKYKLIKNIYGRNTEFFAIKNYYFFHLDKNNIFIWLYIVLLIVFFFLIGSILDGSFIKILINLDIQLLSSILISIIVIGIGFLVKGRQQMFNLLYFYIKTVINIIPYICVGFFIYWLIFEPSLMEVLKKMSNIKDFRLCFIMFISFIFIITQNIKGFYNILIVISLGNIISIFSIFLLEIIYKDVYTIIVKSLVKEDKQMSSIVAANPPHRGSENFYREAVVEYKAILFENNKQLEEALNRSIIAYLKNMANQTLSVFLGINIDKYFNLFLPSNLQIDDIRFNTFMDKFLKEKGLFKEVSLTNKPSLTKLDVWKFIAPMFTSAQINFFYPPKVQSLIEVVPMHQKIVVSDGIDYHVTLDREHKNGKLWITSSRIADGLTNTKCLTLSELVSWKVNCSGCAGNNKFSFWSTMQNNSTAYGEAGSIELIKLGKPNLPNFNIVEEKLADIILKNPSIIDDIWDGETLVGSDWGNETAVGSESNVDSKVCEVVSLKLPDPQLNFSQEYLDENRLQSVFVNKGKDRATSLDLLSDNEENSHIIVENIHLNQLANWLDEDVNRALNESRQTHQYNLRVGESSSRGARGLYGQENNTSINLQNEPVGLVENESIVFEAFDEGLEEIYGGDYPSPGIDGEDKSQDGGDKSQDCPDNLDESAQRVMEFKDAQGQAQAQNEFSRDRSSSLSSLSSHNSEEFIDIWDKNLCINEFTIFLDSVKHKEEIFDPNLFDEFLKDYNLNMNSAVNNSINYTVSNKNMNEYSNRAMPHLSLQKLISLSSNLVQNFDRSATGEEINNRVKKKINLKTGQSLYTYTLTKLTQKKHSFNRSLKRLSDLAPNEKQELTSKFNLLYKEYNTAIKEKKNSYNDLEDLNVKIDQLLTNIWGYDRGRRSFSNDKALNKRIHDLKASINTTKMKLGKSIKNSNLSEKDKGWLLEQVSLIASNLKKQIDITPINKVDQLFKGVYEVQGLLRKQSAFWGKDKFTDFFRKQFDEYCYYHPESDESWLISRLFKNIRDRLITVIHHRLIQRIYLASDNGFIKDKQAVFGELRTTIDILNMDMYFSSNLEDVCQKVLRVLLDLNYKYFFPVNLKVSLIRTNYFIQARFREILEQAIKKDL